VHVGRDHEEAQNPIKRTRQVDVCVVEERSGVQDHLEEQHRNRRWPECRNDGELDSHRHQDLHGVEPQAGRRVEIKIRVVHPVQPPERGHGVKHHVLKVDREIQDQHRDHDGEPDRRVDVVEETPAALLRHHREADREDRETEPQKRRVQHHEREIVRPADDPWNLPTSARCRDFPERHGRQNAQKRGDADGRLGDEECLGHGCRSGGLVKCAGRAIIQVIA